MTRKLLAGLAAVALAMSASAALAECYSGHTAAKQTPVTTAQNTTSSQTSSDETSQE